MRVTYLLLLAPLMAGCGETTGPTTVDEGMNNTALVSAPSDTGMMANDGMMMNGSAMAMSPEQFVNAAAASDAYEIASSELALERIQSGELRQFAQQMITDHRKSSADLKAAAGSIQPQPNMTPAQQQMVEALRSAQGAQFASLYRDQQMQVHRQTLETLRGFADGGQDAALRQFAANTAPVVQNHLEMLEGMSTGG